MTLTERFNKLRFNWAIRAIEGTPPVLRGKVAYTALSMVHHRDVLPYLLALKSMARYLAPAQVVMVADPTIDAEDRARIRDHVPHIVFRDATEFRRQGLPVGGCWERLHAISQYAADSYVVQIDADTVAIADPKDVRAAIEDGVSFALGTEDDSRIKSTADTAAWARGRQGGSEHVQGLAESCLDRFDPDGRYRYVRGCSGFAGFARRSIDPDAVLAVSSGMAPLLANHWSEWGTEQFSSNLLVASSPGARVLPHPRYCAPHRRTAETVFIHFIGYVRFTSSLYVDVARDVAGQLRRPGVPAPEHVA